MSKKAFFSGAAGAVAALLLAIILVPQYHDYSAKAQAYDDLALLEPLKQRVANRVIELRRTEGSGSNIDLTITPTQSDRIVDLVVTHEGIIIFRTRPRGQLFALIPTLSRDEVTWHCLAGSLKDVPVNCG